MSTSSFILICTDGSVYAPSVYDHAAWAAERLGSGVRVVHVAEPGEAGATAARPESAISLLITARHHLKTAGVRQVETAVLEGSVDAALGAMTTNPDLVVLGKRGEHANLLRTELGRNLEAVVRHVEGPFLVASRQFKPIRRAIFAFDASPAAERALAYVAEKPLLRNISLHLIAAIEERPELPASLERARVLLGSVGHTVTVETSVAYPDIAIASAARRLEADLLIMGAFGHSRVRNFFMGSTTSTMLRALPTPALLFR